MVTHRLVKRECKMKFTIHGVRGSVPTPDVRFLKYGGNTSCFEIETSNTQIFCDAGTGFRSAELLRDKKEVSVFFTHFHHDHIQGFPFNPGLFSQVIDQLRNKLFLQYPARYHLNQSVGSYTALLLLSFFLGHRPASPVTENQF